MTESEPPAHARTRPINAATSFVPYLTPHKIAILILIEFYCQGQCPAASSTDLLLFLLECIEDPLEYMHTEASEIGAKIVSKVGAFACDHLYRMLVRIASPFEMGQFIVSREKIEVVDPNTLVARDAGLFGLVVNKRDIGNERAVFALIPSSPLGLYVRRAQLEYRKLTFEDSTKLSAAFINYIMPIQPQDEKLFIESVSPGSSELTVLANIDVEKFLDSLISEYSKPDCAELSEELLQYTYDIQNDITASAKSLYLRSIRAQQIGNYEDARQSLQRFFDYSLHYSMISLFPYSSLDMALLHMNFGHREQALRMLQETIEAARNEEQVDSMNYALNWQYRMTRNTGNPTPTAEETQALTTMIGQSDTPELQTLRCLSELTTSQLTYGESAHDAFVALARALSISTRNTLKGVGGMIHQVQSSIWSAYGNQRLSALHSQLQEEFYASDIDANNAADSLVKRASDLHSLGDTKGALQVLAEARSKFPSNTLKSAPWLQSLVRIMQRRAMSSLRIRDAEISARQLDSTLVKNCDYAIRFQNRKHDFRKKRNSYNNAHDSSSSSIHLDLASLDLQLDAMLQRLSLETLLGQGLAVVSQLSEAKKLLQRKHWPGSQRLMMMTLLAQAEIEISSEREHTAVQLLIEAMELSEHSQHRSILYLVKLRLAEVYLLMDKITQASCLLESLDSESLDQSDLYLQSLAQCQRARCILAKTNKLLDSLRSTDDQTQPRLTESSETDIKNQLQLAQLLLERSLEGFQRIESLKEMAQVLFSLVLVYRELGQEANMKQALAMYRTTESRIHAGLMQDTPSWYLYYGTRDALGGLLGEEDGDLQEDRSSTREMPSVKTPGSAPSSGAGTSSRSKRSTSSRSLRR